MKTGLPGQKNVREILHGKQIDHLILTLYQKYARTKGG
jgi:hypothetical protein